MYFRVFWGKGGAEGMCGAATKKLELEVSWDITSLWPSVREAKKGYTWRSYLTPVSKPGETFLATCLPFFSQQQFWSLWIDYWCLFCGHSGSQCLHRMPWQQNAAYEFKATLPLAQFAKDFRGSRWHSQFDEDRPWVEQHCLCLEGSDCLTFRIIRCTESFVCMVLAHTSAWILEALSSAPTTHFSRFCNSH
jgi:hypothetical protein